MCLTPGMGRCTVNRQEVGARLDRRIRALRKRFVHRTNDSIVFLDQKVYRVRVVHQDIVLVIKELVSIGGSRDLMKGLVKHIGIFGSSLAEDDVVLGDLPC